MGAVIIKSIKKLKNTRPELMALKLLALARRVLQTSPDIKTPKEKTNT